MPRFIPRPNIKRCCFANLSNLSIIIVAITPLEIALFNGAAPDGKMIRFCQILIIRLFGHVDWLRFISDFTATATSKPYCLKSESN